MNTVVASLSSTAKDRPAARVDVRGHQNTGANPVYLGELIHELRQPLGVIESLAYCLELTSADEKACAHVRRIQAMVSQANRILERAALETHSH